VTTANSGKISEKGVGKNKPPTGRPWNKGQSGNPKGRPKDGQSWKAVISEVSNMTAEEIVVFLGEKSAASKHLRALPKNIQVKYLVTAHVLAGLLLEPSAGLWNGLMDRMDGKVKEQVENSGAITLTVRYEDRKPADES